MKSSHLLIGEITKPQGVKGEIKLRPITSDVGRFEGLKTAYFKRGEEYVPFNMTVNRITEDAVFFNMEGIDDREQVEKLRGEMVYIDRAHAIKLNKNATFICDLIGLKGIDDEGNEVGALIDVMQPGGNDVYVFSGARGEVLVPALKSVILDVDVDNGTVLLSSQRMKEVAVYSDED